MLEFLSNGSQMNLIILLITFVLFLVLAFKVFKLIIKAAIVIVISALFPVVMKVFFNWPIPLNFSTIMFFANLGLSLFFVYMFAKFIYSVLKGVEWAGRKVFLRKKQKRKK